MNQTEQRAARVQLMIPFILTLAIIIVDQITKAVIVATMARTEYTGAMVRVIGDFLRIIHVRNLGVAFSIGRNLPIEIRRILFIVLPLVVVAGLAVYYVRSDEFTRIQRWAVAGIIGGGLGNVVDRIFRVDGVVDWVDVRFYGIFGLERWPTFNVADASVVVCGILLMVSVLVQSPANEPATGVPDEPEGETR